MSDRENRKLTESFVRIPFGFDLAGPSSSLAAPPLCRAPDHLNHVFLFVLVERVRATIAGG